MFKTTRLGAGVYTFNYGAAEFTLTQDQSACHGYQWSATCPLEGIPDFYGSTKKACLEAVWSYYFGSMVR